MTLSSTSMPRPGSERLVPAPRPPLDWPVHDVAAPRDGGTEAEMGAGAQGSAHTAIEQLPHRHAEMFAEDVPSRQIDAADRRYVDDAHAPETVLGHDLEAVLDVARILIYRHRLDIGDGTDDSAGLELAPAD